MATVEEYGALWETVKELVKQTDLDVAKNVAGNSAAGNRVRKVLRELSKALKAVKNASLALDKVEREARKAAKTATKAE